MTIALIACSGIGIACALLLWRLEVSKRLRLEDKLTILNAEKTELISNLRASEELRHNELARHQSVLDFYKQNAKEMEDDIRDIARMGVGIPWIRDHMLDRFERLLSPKAPGDDREADTLPDTPPPRTPSSEGGT
jgi:hypothetical protein